MIKEDYVSLEVAKLLKEKGFDEPCDFVYDEDKLEWIHHKFIFINGKISTNSTFNFDGIISAPTLQMAMKWLREKHSIFIAQEFGWFHGDYEYQASVVKMNPIIPPALDSIDYIKVFRNKTCEKACEKAIKYCLENLI